MDYQRQYEQKIGWKNSPDTSTPLNATNLGKMDNALNYMDEKLSEAINGGIVEANPSGSATSSLNKIGINGTIYGISGGGGGSYTAGAGISIANNVITNTRKGALSGVIDEITSGGYAHTQINNALDSITAGGLVVLKAETSGTANTVRIQYGEQASQSQAYRLCDTDLEYATINVSVGDMIILMFDTTGYKLIVLSILNNSGGSGGDSYAGLGIGKMTSFTNNVIDTDIDLHRAPVEGDRLLIWFNTTVQSPTGLTTYNNGTAVTSNLENVSPLLYNAGWNLVEYMNDGLLYNNVWVRKQNVPIPNNTLSGLSDTAISVNPTDGQVLTYNGTTGKWGNQNPSGGVAESVVGTAENDTTASKAYAVGEHFIRNDKFCTAIAAIASGATLTLNTNYVEGTIAECIARQGTYSTTETEIGTFNGKKFYRKMVDCGQMPNATNKWVTANLGNVDYIVTCRGFAKNTAGSQIALPYINPTPSWNAAIQYNDSTDTVHPDTVQISVQQNFTSYTDTWAILEYTKP